MKHCQHLLIIHYNNPRALGRTLASYLAHGVAPGRIHIFDNASDAQSRNELVGLELRHQVPIIYSDENLGWGRAINRFIASRNWSEGDVLGISAHDALLEKADWAVLDDEFTDKTVLFICPQYPVPLQCEFSAARSFRCKPANDIPRMETVVGHATLCFVRPIAIKQLRFDESCFIYGCESEIFLRAHDAGYKTIITNRIVVVNPVTDSSSEFCGLAFGINSLYIAKLRLGWRGYFVRVLAMAFSILRLAMHGKYAETASKRRAILFSLRSGGAGFNEYLNCKT